jgi:hypothetical protein
MIVLVFPLAILAGVGIALLRGGRWRADHVGPWQAPWLAVVAIALRLAVTLDALPLRRLVGDAGNWVFAASGVLVLVFVALNRTVPGFGLIALGSILNLVVTLANDGYMPASAAAAEVAGGAARAERLRREGHLLHVTLLTEQTRLPFLGDVVPVPAGWPFADVYSAGDLLLIAGGGYFGYAGLVVPRGQPVRTQDLTDGHPSV